MSNISKIILAVLGIAVFACLLFFDIGKISYSDSPFAIQAANRGEIARDGWVRGEAIRCYDVSSRLSLLPENHRKSGVFDFLYRKKVKSYYAVLSDGTAVPVRANEKWYSDRFNENGMPKDGAPVVISGFAGKIDSELRDMWQGNARSVFWNEAGDSDEISVDGRTIRLTYITQDFVNARAYSFLLQRIICSALAIAACIIYAVLCIVGIIRERKDYSGPGIIGKVLAFLWGALLIWHMILGNLV